MPLLTIEGETLGEKRRHFNKLVADAVASKHYELTPIDYTDSDIHNLLKIEIACKTRNVDYVIEVMKSKDMLYASTAIKKSTWLITDPQYANIINPEYLHTQLKPYMTTKAFNKLMLHVRLNLKDERRVETFYEYFKETDTACKWLHNCSFPFIENVIKNERLVPKWLFERLCKRSSRFLIYNARVEMYPHERGQSVLFMLKSQTESVLNIMEDYKIGFIPKMGKKRTEFLLKKCPHRILDNIKKYHQSLDANVLVKYIKYNKDIKGFLYQHATTMRYNENFKTLGLFIKNMEEAERIEFVKASFIDKTKPLFHEDDFEYFGLGPVIHSYEWYEFFPFEIAFTKIKNLLRKQESPSERCTMLSVLVNTAKTNAEHIKTLLSYVIEKHVNDPFKFKIKFVIHLLSNVSPHKLDMATWNILDQLFHSMDVYTETENDVQLCRESIILRKVLNDEPVPEIIEQKCTFAFINKIGSSLNKKQKNKLFIYALNSLMSKIQINKIVNKSDADESLRMLQDVLILLKDWNRQLFEYPLIYGIIQRLIEIKEEKGLSVDLSCFYNVNKSWRKDMFEESLSLSLCEETCLNVLKHKPQLLTRHDKQIHTLRTNDAVSLRRVLAKLRVYWPDTFAQHWREAYMESIHNISEQKAAIKGLFQLSPLEHVIEMAKSHVPFDSKINWSDTNQAEISLKKNIARHLHLTRPRVPLDTVLWYAKGDYLQYAVPPLSAILYNVSKVESREYLPKLLNAPVSLQKLGIRLVYTKFEAIEVKYIFSDIWKSTKNATVRAIIFENIFNQLCGSKNLNTENELWELLSMFMQEVNLQDSTRLYKILSNIKSVPINVRGKYYIKSYEIFKSLPESHVCVRYLNNVIAYAAYIMELLDEDFVANKLLSPVESKFYTHNGHTFFMYLNVLTCFLLCSKSEEIHVLRFRKIERALEEAFKRWHDIRSGDFYVKNNFNRFLKLLVKNFQDYFIHNKIPIPGKLFELIQRKMQKELQLVENYVLFTSWALVTEYVKCMNEHSSNILNIIAASTSQNAWKDINLEVCPSLGENIINYLRKDTEKYSSAVHDLFADALSQMFLMLNITDDSVLETLSHMLYDQEFIPSYLVVCKCIPNFCCGKSKLKRSEIRNQMKSHPSALVRMQYHRYFYNIPEDSED
ncbi:hypothetical protein HF086_006094 [Spodoptera exigua]|uniref:Uncharacterized protein n=1 Tax=Spodoptera exigua TaxID=7107 RepID=A0A922SLH8_SPOEX|nr:hypothetical protein HF086_006094 [Spodoptera exigua]